MQELRLVAVSEDGTYLVLATAGRGTRFTLPVDDRLRAAVRGNFSRLGQYEIEVESPLRPKEIQARIRAGETAEEIANTAGIPVERVRWFEGPVLQEREYMAQQAQRCAVRLPGDSAPGPTLGDLVAERLTRRGVPADEIEWDSAKRDDNMWRIKLGFVWNGHTRNAEWLFDPRRRHITPHDDEALRLSSGEDVKPVEDTTVTPFVPRVAKLAPVPPLAPEPPNQQPVSFPSVLRHESVAQPRPAYAQTEPPAAYQQPPMPPLPAGYEAPRVSVPPLRAPDPAGYQSDRASEPAAPAAEGPGPAARVRPPEPVLPEPVTAYEPVSPAAREPAAQEPAAYEPLSAPEPEPAAPAAPQPVVAVQPPGTAAEPARVGPPSAGAPEPVPATTRESATGSDLPGQAPAHAPAAPPEAVVAEAAKTPEAAKAPEVMEIMEAPQVAEVSAPLPPAAATPPEPVAVPSEPAGQRSAADEKTAGQPVSTKAENTIAAKETPAPESEPAQEGSIAVPAARVSVDERAKAEPGRQETQGDTGAMQETKVDKPAAEKPAEPPKPAPAPARPAKKSRGRRASVPTWDEIMFGARRQD
ncbi:septation protein SepH [Streptosporangium sp. NPDC049644]|uniref:septation protein SepH n=1 Tax=Streptosporangium sp. NPDC049644 TaxID=3155507 RepID=UPI003437C990